VTTHADASSSARPAGSTLAVVPILVVVATIVLGLPEGSMGVLWPSISADLGQPLAASGILLYSCAGGYLSSALLHGRLIRRFGTAQLLIGGAVLGLVAALSFAISPTFLLCAIAYYGIGLAGGCIDTANNSYVALNHSHRLLAVMHGGFGIGAFLGPAIVAVMLNRGVSWRFAFVGLAAYELGLLVLFVIFRSRFVGRTGADDRRIAGTRIELLDIDIPMTGESLATGTSTATTSATATAIAAEPTTVARPGRRLMLLLSMASFFAYTGVEVGVGFWGYSLLVSRGISEGVAGLGVSAYWLALTVGRFSIGAAGRRVSPRQVLAGAVTGAIVGTSLLWFGGVGPNGAVSLAAMVVIGACLAGVFPSLVALTPDRLGTEGASAAIGWQLATASLGTSTIPAVIGVIASRAGVASIGPALVVAALLLAAVHATATVVDNRNRRSFVPR
jgi:fucose permease